MIRNAIVLMLVLLFLPATAHANMATDTGAKMISNGIDSWFDSSASSMIGNQTNATAQMSRWFNPFTVPIVKKTNHNLLIFAVMVFILIVFGGLAYLAAQTWHRNTARTIENIINNGTAFDLKAYSSLLGRILAGWILLPTILFLLLIIAYGASADMDTKALGVIELSSDSGWMKFIYSCTSYLLMIVFGLRNLGISSICAFMVLYPPLHEIPILSKLIKIIMIYLFLLIFMQPVVVGSAAISIETALFLGLPSVTALIITIAISLLFIVGPIYFHKLFFDIAGR